MKKQLSLNEIVKQYESYKSSINLALTEITDEVFSSLDPKYMRAYESFVNRLYNATQKKELEGKLEGLIGDFMPSEEAAPRKTRRKSRKYNALCDLVQNKNLSLDEALKKLGLRGRKAQGLRMTYKRYHSGK